jgi:hypothetical protein
MSKSITDNGETLPAVRVSHCPSPVGMAKKKESTLSMRVEKPSGLKPHAGTKRKADDDDAAVDWVRLGKRM